MRFRENFWWDPVLTPLFPLRSSVFRAAPNPCQSCHGIEWIPSKSYEAYDKFTESHVSRLRLKDRIFAKKWFGDGSCSPVDFLKSKIMLGGGNDWKKDFLERRVFVLLGNIKMALFPAVAMNKYSAVFENGKEEGSCLWLREMSKDHVTHFAMKFIKFLIDDGADWEEHLQDPDHSRFISELSESLENTETMQQHKEGEENNMLRCDDGVLKK